MTLDDLRALADKFFEWPEGSGRQTVTTFSALLFAQHVLQLREKSLGTENKAGVYALREAAQRQLEALAAYRREIGLLTGVPDEQPCDAEVALRAALEQQAELSEGLGPLPPTTYVLARESDGYSPERLLSEAGYTEEHMRAYAAAAVALERDSKQALPVGEMRLSEIIDGMVVPVVTADLPVGTKLYTSPPQRKPVEPVEPVGWLESPHGAFRVNPLYKMQFPSQLLHWQIALYAALPQRKPLTDEEIEYCRQQGYAHAGLSAPFDFGKAARAIERKVRGDGS